MGERVAPKRVKSLGRNLGESHSVAHLQAESLGDPFMQVEWSRNRDDRRILEICGRKCFDILKVIYGLS
jgi:hypothetical protein